MKKLIWIILVGLLVMPVFGEDDFQRKMLRYLAEGLTTTDDLWGGNYRRFYDYVKEQHLNNGSFRKFAGKSRWKLAFREDENYCYLGINDTGFELKKLPLYPVLDGRSAVIASFYSKDELNYRQLPDYLKAYYQKIEAENALIYEREKDNPKFSDGEIINRRIGVRQLQKDISLFFEEKLWLVSENGNVEAGLESLYFRTICDYGFYQIIALLNKELKDGVFLFQTAAEKKLPVIIKPRFDLSRLPFGFQNKDVSIAPLDRRGRLIFIGSNNNSTSEFYLIWNTVKRRIEYLKMSSGYCLGNEPRYLDRNYLFEYEGKYYLLRYSRIRRYAEVLYFKGPRMMQIYHADTTSPEI
jgi:hypothetical protein